MTHRLTPEMAARYASIALGHVEREYPNKLDHVLNGPADAQGPRALHPIFYGSSIGIPARTDTGSSPASSADSRRERRRKTSAPSLTVSSRKRKWRSSLLICSVR